MNKLYRCEWQNTNMKYQVRYEFFAKSKDARLYDAIGDIIVHSYDYSRHYMLHNNYFNNKLHSTTLSYNGRSVDIMNVYDDDYEEEYPSNYMAREVISDLEHLFIHGFSGTSISMDVWRDVLSDDGLRLGHDYEVDGTYSFEYDEISVLHKKGDMEAVYEFLCS